VDFGAAGIPPFKFADLGHTLSAIIQSIDAPTLIGSESVDGAGTWRIHGSLPSERLRGLVTNAEPVHEVKLEGWIDKDIGLLRKVQIAGQIYSQDSEDVVGNLTLHGFDEPVEISLPNTPG